jgi:hypothetical protein
MVTGGDSRAILDSMTGRARAGAVPLGQRAVVRRGRSGARAYAFDGGIAVPLGSKPATTR